MEKIYYPSRKRVLFLRYLFPVALWLIGFSTSVLVAFLRGRSLPDFDWFLFLMFWFMAVVIDVLLHRFWAEGLAIHISPTAIRGPIGVGRDEPIPFDEINYSKTLHRKRFGRVLPTNSVFSLHGDRIDIHESLFEPEDITEIRRLLFDSERQNRKRSD
jgi:hypothetical protein